ncbi:hypothetical protein F2Q70_00038830 [Brassica cretica]|uniref:Uncharacterized protein n=1 Tax=Brassica cretica TaxID=69181 RepID=A0A8S9K727_BRACR|nr:hypothetical protein F2Q70_00038830 [Brassica cretica]
MHDNLYTTYKLDRKGLTGKQVSRISTPGRTTKVLIPSTRVRCCRRDQDFRTLVLPLIQPNLPDLPNRSQEQRKNSSELGANYWDQNRIRTISLRERLLKASDNGSWTAKHPLSNSPKGRVGPDALTNSPVRGFGSVQLAEQTSWIEQAVQLACSASWTSPTQRTSELGRACSPTHPFSELYQSACLRPVLEAPPFRIRSNLL